MQNCGTSVTNKDTRFIKRQKNPANSFNSISSAIYTEQGVSDITTSGDAIRPIFDAQQRLARVRHFSTPRRQHSRRAAGHVVGLGSTHATPPAACGGGGRQRGKHLVTLAVFLTSVTLERASNNKCGILLQFDKFFSSTTNNRHFFQKLNRESL